MADVFPKTKRSWLMSRVRGMNTSPELTVRSFLHRHGFRYRLHAASLPGKPDIVLRKHRAIVLVNGCFWHGHKDCPRAKLPSTNKLFWRKKIGKNVARDSRTLNRLRALQWKVYEIWSCELMGERSRRQVLARLVRKLKRSI
jgi:DNA mismatch endonuclease (patch repair protein)